MAKKVLFINQEITPYVPETEMSILGRDLPQKTQEAGFEIRTFMPKWGTINERRGQLHEVKSGDDYADNGERAIFYARGVLETVKKLRWTPDIIVCQGWISAVVPFYIKKAFNEEPSFANAKVITSFHENQLKSDLGEDFTKLVDFKEAQSSLLEGYAKPFDFMELGKLAIDYSDGIIEAGKDVNPELLAYAKEKNIPVMSNPGDDYAQSYADFFNKIAGE